MDQKDTAREIHPVRMFNRPGLGQGVVSKDFRPMPVGVNDEMPKRATVETPVVPVDEISKVEVDVDPKLISSATGNATPFEIDSGEQTILQQTLIQQGNAENPANVEKVTPERPPLQ